MLSGRDIICISSIDWDAHWQIHHQIASSLVAAGNRVLFVENTGVRAPGVRDFSRMRQRVANWWRSTKGFREVQSGPLRLFAPLRAVSVFVGRALVQSHRHVPRPDALDGRRQLPPSRRLDVPADADRARSHRRRGSVGRRLLLRRRFRGHVAGRAAREPERDRDVPPRRSGVRHLRAAAPEGGAGVTRPCTRFPRVSISEVRGACGSRRTVFPPISRRCRARWRATSARCTCGSIRTSWRACRSSCRM